MSADRLALVGMRFSGRHGVLPHEHDEPQPFEVDVVLHGDLSRPAASDDLRDTADYGAIFDLVRGIVEGPHHDLIESLAGAIADRVLETTGAPAVASVEVRVRKPKAPLGGAFETVEVALLRHREQRSGDSA
ncbi:MAG TPA: dihydroneopterin aldolase [Candidatus Limnocylindria bacterium]|jgi:dihydroneopterin aldolase|nr:dihydroneopterin aldolase [Candidatus Limnocylindria bacterium]